MDIVDLLNRLTFERMRRQLLATLTGSDLTYACDDSDILATAIEVCHA